MAAVFAPSRRTALDLLLPLLLCFTGAAGLGYEVTLSRLLSVHLGSSGASQAVTLGVFLGGMALGALAVGRWGEKALARLKRPLVAFGALEIFVAIWVLLFPILADVAFTGYRGLGLDPTTLTSILARLVTAGLLILPLSAAMGATLPVLAAGVERLCPDDAVRLVSKYYALNAAGAAAGALIAGFWLIENLGLDATLHTGAAISATSGLLAILVFGTQTAAAMDRPVRGPQRDATIPALPWLVTAAGLTGISSLASEVAWTRLYGLALGGSAYAFSAMLAVVIAGIAIGSGLAGRWVNRGGSPIKGFVAAQVVAATAALWLVWRMNDLPVDLLRLRVRMTPIPENYGFWLTLGGGFTALHLLPAALALGASFPLLLSAADRTGARPDRATAWILGTNTLGNLVGSLATGFLVMPWLGLEKTLCAAGVLSLVVAFVALPRPRRLVPMALLGAAVLAAVAFAALTPPASRLQMGLFRNRAKSLDAVDQEVRDQTAVTLFRNDGKDASITVDRMSSGMMLFRTNGKPDGSTGDATTQIMLGHLGFLFRPDAHDVFIVGLGTGQTAGAASSHPNTRVTVAELSPAVLQVARFFAHKNGKVLERPNVSVRVADAREVMASLPDASLDLVISEPSNPWVAGIADMFTTEHFQRVRQKLRPNGVLVQWIHTYETTDDLLRDTICTLRSVLPNVAIFQLLQGDFALVASFEPLELNAAKAFAMLNQPAVKADLTGYDEWRLPIALDEWMTTQLTGPATVNRLCSTFETPFRERFPRLEFEAPRAFFAGIWATELTSALDMRKNAKSDTFQAEFIRRAPLDDTRRTAIHNFLRKFHVEPDQALLDATLPTNTVSAAEEILAKSLPDSKTVDERVQTGVCGQLRKSAQALIDNPMTQYGPSSHNAKIAAWYEICRLQKPANQGR
jgi:spermidine synthase